MIKFSQEEETQNPVKLKLRVLHVDDNVDYLEIFSHLFSRYLNIRSIDNPSVVTDILRKEQFDAVITDYEMPGMDGLELLKEIRSDFPGIPVIFYTGQGNEEVAREAFLNGASDYFIKDISGLAHQERLVNAIKRAVLINSEKEFSEKLIETANTMVIGLDVDGNISIFNRCAEEITGYSRFEVMGRNWFELFIPKEEFISVMGEYRRLMSGKTALTKGTFENSILTKSQEQRYIAWQNNILENMGIIKGTISFGMDITDKKQAEEALLKSERINRKILNSLPDSVLVYDSQGRHVFVTDRTEKYSGIAKKDCIGKTIDNIGLPEELSDFLKEQLNQVIEKKELVEFEFPFSSNEGFMHISCRLLPVFDDNGKIELYISICRNITEVRQIQQNYQMLFEAMLEGVAIHEIITDELGKPVDYRFLAVNPAYERLTGLKGHDIIGKTVREILPDIEQSWIETYGRVALTGEPAFFQNHTDSLNREYNIVAFRPTVNQFACIIEDITRKKQVETDHLLIIDIINLLNRYPPTMEIVEKILYLLKERTGFEAVALRLRNGDDYPYFVYNGFSDAFIIKEKHLCVYDDAGEMELDEHNLPVLECMCGNIIRGRTNPDLPFFTKGGSFWTNSTTKLLAGFTEEEISKTRNHCHNSGYETVALIPIISDDETIGLLQLNDRRPDLLTPDRVLFFEELCRFLGPALNRFSPEKLIIEKNRELAYLAERICHDLKSPIFNLEGFISLTEGDPSVFADIKSRILNQVERLSLLISSLDALSKTGRIVEKKYPVNLKLLIDKVYGVFSKTGITSELKTDIRQQEIYADYNSIYKAFSGIFENSFKHADSDKTDLLIEIKSSREGLYSIITICDNVFNVDAKDAEFIFMPGAGAGCSSFGSTYNLALAKKYIEANGGTLKYKNRGRGMGACFYIRLPVI